MMLLVADSVGGREQQKAHRRRTAEHLRRRPAPVHLQAHRQPPRPMLRDLPKLTCLPQAEPVGGGAAPPRGRRAPPTPPAGPPSARTPAQKAANMTTSQLVQTCRCGNMTGCLRTRPPGRGDVTAGPCVVRVLPAVDTAHPFAPVLCRTWHSLGYVNCQWEHDRHAGPAAR